MSLLIRTDVTAVKLYGNYVLTGIGSSVHVYERDTAKLSSKIQALKGQKIYGFAPSKCGSKILVFGGKQWTVLNVTAVEGSCMFSSLFASVVCDDWLQSGVWLENGMVVLLTAHNVVQKWSTNPSLISQNISRDNSILYSGLLVPLASADVLVLAGTVFSEVIVHCCGDEPLHRLTGHRGVIFSISCDPQKGLIVTTSDDRSVRIWKINNHSNETINTVEYWKDAEITCLNEVYGHSARVMRNCILNDLIVSVGEDSIICYWNLEGILLRKVASHQKACIWSVDGDTKSLVTGGGDCGVILHPLSIATEYGSHEVLDIEIESPKKIVFTARRNFVVLSENNEMIYLDIVLKSKMVYKLNHESTYKLLTLSSCKQIIAVADMNGKLDVFVENCKDSAYLQNVIDTKLEGKVLSMHWACNRHLVFCGENGVITVLASIGSKTEIVANFLLPPCKERWLTAVATSASQRVFIVGDRCGSIHFYLKGLINPIKSFSKVHGRYGPTTIIANGNEIKTTGRDGTIKNFYFHEDMSVVKYMSSRELEFQWVEKFLDKDERLVCGFHERTFVVDDVKTNSRLLEIPCGGGHRSWDAVRYIDKVDEKYDEVIKFIYLKNASMHLGTFKINKIVSRNIVMGSQAKIINCLKTFTPSGDKSVTFLFSGGEDTTLRISSINAAMEFKDEVVFKQLSSIRTLKVHCLEDNKVLLISAGGRAQICIKTVTFENEYKEVKPKAEILTDYLIKGPDKQRKVNQNWRNSSIDFDPETRIMDLDIIQSNSESFLIFAGCSDACLRVFELNLKPKTEFKPIQEYRHHKTCILKTVHIQIQNKNFIVTCSTRGEIVFWDIANIKDVENLKVSPIFTTKTNKSGINSFASKSITYNEILIATGGDDNSINLVVLEFLNKGDTIIIKHRWNSDKYHCSQITGLVLLDDMLISASIDQRVTVFRWRVGNEGIKCDYVRQMFSDVADIQGIDVVDDHGPLVCVYGQGVEVIQVPPSE